MKITKMFLYSLCLAATFTMAQAQENKENDQRRRPEGGGRPERPERRELTEEQKKLQKDILAKYDANKDGRLDREERQKISQEDREQMRKAGLGGRGPGEGQGRGPGDGPGRRQGPGERPDGGKEKKEAK